VFAVADSTQSSIEIAAPPEQVMAVISDLESYPQWVDALTAVEVLTVRDGRPDTVRMALRHKLLSDDYTVRYSWTENEVGWRLVSGRALSAMDGAYTVEPSGSGCRVTYRLTVELKLRLPALLRRTAEKTITDAALHGLQRQVTTVRGSR
jgi:ribosome-associated toxin RatA of RatAB toxin-antitoxin module